MSMIAHLPARSARRLNLRTALMILIALVTALGLAGVMSPGAAQAANATVAQCNSQGPGGGGATTVMNCDVTVTNTINGGVTSSVVTVSRVCANDPCTGSSSINSSNLVTIVDQCNGSDNDAAHPITCNINIINNISADTPGAQPVSALTVNQCVGSFQGGGGNNLCVPFPASTSGATVTQCNGSANGGGGTTNCTASGTISPAIPISVNQCNGTGNPGGSVVTCSVHITTNITAAAVTPTPTPTPSVTPTTPGTGGTGGTPTSPATLGGTPTSPATLGGTPTSPATLGGTPGTPGTPGTVVGAPFPTSPATVAAVPQVQLVPTGGIATGGGSTAGLRHSGLLLLGFALLLAAGFAALVRRRFTRAG